MFNPSRFVQLIAIFTCACVLAASARPAHARIHPIGLTLVAASVALCATVFVGYPRVQQHWALQELKQKEHDSGRFKLLGTLDYSSRAALVEALESQIFAQGASYEDVSFGLTWLPMLIDSMEAERDVNDAELQDMYVRALRDAVWLLEGRQVQLDADQVNRLLESLEYLLTGPYVDMMVFNLKQASRYYLPRAPKFRDRQADLLRHTQSLYSLLLWLADDAGSSARQLSNNARWTAVRLLGSALFDVTWDEKKGDQVLERLNLSSDKTMRETAAAVLKDRSKRQVNQG